MISAMAGSIRSTSRASAAAQIAIAEPGQVIHPEGGHGQRVVASDRGLASKRHKGERIHSTG